jgi:signal peptidase II
MTNPELKSSGIRWLWISLLVIAADQLSKLWIERTMALGEGFAALPVLDIVRAHNPGAAFSFLATAGGWQRWAFTIVAVVISALLVGWLRKLALATHKLLAGGLALILGGAIGNVIDRFEHGYVVDFLSAHWGGSYFPAFNIADAAISIGAGCVILDAILEARRERQVSKQAAIDGQRPEG